MDSPEFSGLHMGQANSSTMSLILKALSSISLLACLLFFGTILSLLPEDYDISFINLTPSSDCAS